MSRLAILCLLMGLLGSASATNPVTRMHVASIQVTVDGELIMTPTVHVIEGMLGEVSVTKGDQTYTLRVSFEDASKQQKDAVSFQGELLRFNAGREVALFNPQAVFTAGTRPTMQIGPEGQGGHGVLIEMLSHSTMDKAIAPGSLKSCNAENTGQAELLGDDSNCCTRRCVRNPGDTLRCCNVVLCCACGACCEVQ